MTPALRWMGSLGCLVTGLDCLEKQGGELSLPYWAWAIVGVGWLIYVPIFAFDKSEPQP